VLGASRGRLVQQLMTESVLIAFAGGVIGLLIGVLGVDALVASAPDSIPRLREAASTAASSGHGARLVATGLLFGIAPAIHASRGGAPRDAEGGRARHRRRPTGRAGHLLVISEVALSLVLAWWPPVC